MLMRNNTKNYIQYIIFAANSFLAALAFIMFQRNFFSESRSEEALFSLPRLISFVGVFASLFLLFLICSIGETRKKYEVFISKVAMHPLLFVLLVSALFRVWYLSHFSSYVIYYDTKTYTDYPFNIFVGETDVFRTPGYPYFLKLVYRVLKLFSMLQAGIGSLFGSKVTPIPEYGSMEFYEAISVAQVILSLVSLVILYLAGRKLFSNKYILSFAVLICGIAPSVFNWDVITLTESLSLFCTVLLIYFVFSYLAKPSLFMAITIGLYSFVMIMVRPTFIYLTAVLGVFFIARLIFNREDRKRALAGLLSVVVCVGMVFGYCGLNYKNYKYFAVSSVNNTVNNLYIVMANGWYYNNDHPEISKYISDAIQLNEGGNWITDIVEVVPEFYSYREIDEYVSDCLDEHSDDYRKYTLNKFYYLMDENVATQYIPMAEKYNNAEPLGEVISEYFSSESTNTTDFKEKLSNSFFKSFSDVMLKYTFPFNFLGCLCVVAIGLVFSFVVLFVKKRICWQIIGLCAIIFSHIFVSIYGSMAEYARLSSMVIPVVILLVFYFLDYIVKSIKQRRFFHLNNNNSTAINIKKGE